MNYIDVNIMTRISIFFVGSETPHKVLNIGILTKKPTQNQIYPSILTNNL